MPPIFLITGFKPFGGERVNPSWDVAHRLDGDVIGSLLVKSVLVPVGCAKAVRRINAAIVRYRPRAILGLGEAGGRTAISLEQVAVNIADERGALKRAGDPGLAPVIDGAPEAYFARAPLREILKELDRAEIPASISLSAGAYACNALMYASLHLTRRRARMPVAFIHLPYQERQSRAHRASPTMSLATMARAVRIAADAIAARAI